MIPILPERQVLSDHSGTSEPSTRPSSSTLDFPALLHSLDPQGLRGNEPEPALSARLDEPMHFRDDSLLHVDVLRSEFRAQDANSPPVSGELVIPPWEADLSGKLVPESGKEPPLADRSDLAAMDPQAAGLAGAQQHTSALAIARANPDPALTGTPSVGGVKARGQPDAVTPDGLRPARLQTSHSLKSQPSPKGEGRGISDHEVSADEDGKIFGTERPAEAKGSPRSDTAPQPAPQPAAFPQIGAIPVPPSIVANVGQSHAAHGRSPASREAPAQKAEIPARAKVAPPAQTALAQFEEEGPSLDLVKAATGDSGTHPSLQTSAQTGSPSPAPSHAPAAPAAPPPTLQPPAPLDPRTDVRPPVQLENTIEHLASAREAGRSASGDVTLRHHEFGAVNMRLEVAGGDLRAVLAARDPGFVPAIQAALAERTVAAGQDASATAAGGQNNGRGSEQSSSHQGSQSGSHPGSQSGSQGWSGASSSQSDPRYGSSTGSGQGSPQPYSDQTEPSEENAARRNGVGPSSGSTHSPRESGLYA